MVNIVLVEPEIPHNTGAIARTCAATGARLHLIKPLGFDISDKAVKRCGLDYWWLVDISVYENLDEYFEKNGDENLWLATTKAPRAYSEVDMSGDVSLMFGKETAGLPEWLRMKYRDRCGALLSGLAFNSSISATKSIISSNVSIPVFCLAETGTAITSPPQSSTSNPCSDNSCLTLSGLADGLSILFIATISGTSAALAWFIASIV